MHFRLIKILSLLLYLAPLLGNEVTISRFNSSVIIDGYLKEADWKNATRIDQFYSYYPVDGQPADQKTVALLGYNETSLYIAFICFDESPDLIRATICSRDDIFDDDNVTLMIDTFNKGKESYEFAFNPFGIQSDGIYIDMESRDLNPDFIFYSKGHRFKQGYIVEIEIPFKSIRFPSDSDVWGFSLQRNIKHLDKDYIWPAITLNSTTFVAQFGKLTGIENISVGRNLEILPEFTSIHQGMRDPQTQVFEKNDIDFQGGVNLKYGISSDLIIDITFNPDFSQIEADADKIDVNRRFPLFYDEKRPFFLEGTNIFQTPINAVYTRQIVDPSAGLKLSGKIGDIEVGLLSGIDEYYGSSTFVTDQAGFLPFFSDSGFNSDYKNKNSYHNILRLRKEVWDYSHVGFLFTDKHFGNSFSTTYGLDGKLLIADQYYFTFQVLNSYTKDLFTSGQKSDPAIFASLMMASQMYRFELSYNDVYEDFEVANGFLPYRESTRRAYREGALHAYYDFLSEQSFIRVVRPSLYMTQMFNHDGKKIESYFAPAITFESAGSNVLSLSFYRQFEEYLSFNFNKNFYFISFESKTLPWLFFDSNIYFGDAIYYESVFLGINPFLGKFESVTLGADLIPLTNWSTRISFSNYNFEGTAEAVRYMTNQDIYRIRSVYQFSNELSIRLIMEHNNLYDDLDLNALFSYHPSPGTVLFFGYNDYFEKNERRNYRRSSRGIFTKISYLFRL
jgi:hypothetical protein